MDLDNPFEVAMYHLLIEWMIGLGHRDRVLMVSVLVDTITH